MMMDLSINNRRGFASREDSGEGIYLLWRWNIASAAQVQILPLRRYHRRNPSDFSGRAYGADINDDGRGFVVEHRH